MAEGFESGWWAVDVASYLLSPVRHLVAPLHGSLDALAMGRWIEATEMRWAPGRIDPPHELVNRLLGCIDDAEAVLTVLQWAVDEVNGADARDPITLAARRRLPVTTLLAVGAHGPASAPVETAPCADGHVHQGASVPFEVMVHWVARNVAALDGRSVRGPSLEDSEGCDFDPLPLLLTLRAVVEGRPEWEEAVSLTGSAATAPDSDAWSRLSDLLVFDAPEPGFLSLEQITHLKTSRSGLSRNRRVAIMRLEAILHGAITQRRPGLDVFVKLFENFAALRRRAALPKARYFEECIRVQQSMTPGMRALELRLGESIGAGNTPSVASLARDYEAALTGYQGYAQKLDAPVRVTFPLSFVKPRELPEQSEYWRFNPTGIFKLIEAFCDFLEDHPMTRFFVDGVDVCGREDTLPNWLFAQAYRLLGERAAKWGELMTFRFHAGEVAYTPVHGLRRIAEFLDFRVASRVPLRIGHGLALQSDDWSGIQTAPADEVLDDLVWGHTRLAQIGAAREGLRLIERAAGRIARRVYPEIREGYGIGELARAYRDRTDVATMRRIGFLELRPDGTVWFPNDPPIKSTKGCDNLVVAHLRARSGPVEPLQAVCGGMELRALQEIFRDMYVPVRDDVVMDIRWGGAIVEACPTSNVLTAGIRGYGQHPIRFLLDRGVLVTINSDDPAVFHVWLGDELVHARELIGLQEGQLERCRKLALRVVGSESEGRDVTARLDAAVRELRGE